MKSPFGIIEEGYFVNNTLKQSNSLKRESAQNDLIQNESVNKKVQFFDESRRPKSAITRSRSRKIQDDDILKLLYDKTQQSQSLDKITYDYLKKGSNTRKFEGSNVPNHSLKLLSDRRKKEKAELASFERQLNKEKENTMIRLEHSIKEMNELMNILKISSTYSLNEGKIYKSMKNESSSKSKNPKFIFITQEKFDREHKEALQEYDLLSKTNSSNTLRDSEEESNTKGPNKVEDELDDHENEKAEKKNLNELEKRRNLQNLQQSILLSLDFQKHYLLKQIQEIKKRGWNNQED